MSENKKDKSKVYFTDMRLSGYQNLQKKLEKLLDKAGLGQVDFKGKYVAIKMHFGEPGNLSYLRPNYAKTVADYVTARGGKPFLTDCNTLYVGRRKNALDHLSSAYENGFSPLSTGCHVIIGDGLKGTDDIAVPVEGGEYVKEAYIGRAIMDADIFISLSHFKGHDCTGFGGALKNIGMGCGSERGKRDMHSAGKPVVDDSKCVGCGTCANNCAQDAIEFRKDKAFIIQKNCAGCGRCVKSCPCEAISLTNNDYNPILCGKIAEYSKAVCDGRPNFHISLVLDVSPHCDCYNKNDPPVIPDVGMFASFDPVALDKACGDAVNKVKPFPEYIPADGWSANVSDLFTNIFPESNWHDMTKHGAKIGLGSEDYELIEM